MLSFPFYRTENNSSEKLREAKLYAESYNSRGQIGTMFYLLRSLCSCFHHLALLRPPLKLPPKTWADYGQQWGSHSKAALPANIVKEDGMTSKAQIKITILITFYGFKHLSPFFHLLVFFPLQKLTPFITTTTHNEQHELFRNDMGIR